MKTDSYIEEVGLKNLGAKNSIIAYLKIAIVFPLIMIWNILKFLFNPKKSVMRVFKQAIVFPILEFFTGKSTSEQILGDYTHFHQAILKKEIFQGDNVKLNFDAHKSILLNSKIATIISIFVLLLVYEIAFDLLSEFQIAFLALSFVTAGITSIFGIAIFAAKALLTIALFAVEINMIRLLFVTSREEIKDYLDETIFYADIKNEEIFGKEHSNKVKNALYEAYLTEKEEIEVTKVDLISKYMTYEKLPSSKKTDNKIEVEK